MTTPLSAQYVHFRERLLERYGMECSRERYAELNQDVIDGAALLICKRLDNGGRERHLYYIRLNGRWVRVGWDPRWKCIVTAFPLLEEHRNFYFRNIMPATAE